MKRIAVPLTGGIPILGKIAVTVCLFSAALSGQDPDTLWTRFYGGVNDESAAALDICADRGYIICGSTASFGAGGWDVYLIRTDDKGDTLWTRTYGGPVDDYGCGVKVTHDAGFVVAGHTRSYGSGGSDLFLIRVDSLGDTVWTRSFGGPNDEEGYAVWETPDFGYLICGTTYSYGAGIGDVFLVKTDSLGDTLWRKTYGGDDNDLGAGLAVLPDSGLMICGTTYSYGAGGGDVYLVRTDPKGDTLWTRTHGGESDEWGYGLTPTSDSGFICSGSSYFSLLGDDMFVFKADRNGNPQWNFFNGSLADDYAYASAEVPGRGYVIVGNFSFELFVIRTDQLGNNQGQWIFGGAGTDFARDVKAHEDGSYAIVGTTNSFGHGAADIWLIRMTRDTLGVKEKSGSVIATPELFVYPNPFRTGIQIRWMMDEGRKENNRANIRIYDISGRLINTIPFPSNRSPDFSRLFWPGVDVNGCPVPAGVYLLECESGGLKSTMTVIRLD